MERIGAEAFFHEDRVADVLGPVSEDLTLAAASHNREPRHPYLEPDHALRRRILRQICRFTGLKGGEIHTMVDSCGLPAFGVTLRATAFSFQGGRGW